MHIESWPLVSLMLLVVILILKIVWLKKQGIQPNKLKSNKSRFGFWMGLAFFFLFAIWLLEVIRPALEPQFYLLPTQLTTVLFPIKALQVAGAMLIILALILFGITLVNFGKSLRFGLDKNNRGKLITTGVFSFSRNPFFLSIDVYVVGIALVLPSIFFLVFAGITVLSIHFFVLKEERFMAENYGEEYKKYHQKTRRYF